MSGGSICRYVNVNIIRNAAPFLPTLLLYLYKSKFLKNLKYMFPVQNLLNFFNKFK